MTDPKIIRAVVYGLVGLALTALVGIVALAGFARPIPDVLQNIAVGSMTAVAGILSKTSAEVTPVAIVDEPVEVITKPAAPRSKAKR